MPVAVQLMKQWMLKTFLLSFDHNQSFKKYMLGKTDCEEFYGRALCPRM